MQESNGLTKEVEWFDGEIWIVLLKSALVTAEVSTTLHPVWDRRAGRLQVFRLQRLSRDWPRLGALADRWLMNFRRCGQKYVRWSWALCIAPCAPRVWWKDPCFDFGCRLFFLQVLGHWFSPCKQSLLCWRPYTYDFQSTLSMHNMREQI